jgi:hypothetical protein
MRRTVQIQNLSIRVKNAAQPAAIASAIRDALPQSARDMRPSATLAIAEAIAGAIAKPKKEGR